MANELILNRIREANKLSSTSLYKLINKKKLYFRVSLVGGCNLSCPFCHNEGAPKKGKVDLKKVSLAMKEASTIGFSRVQFTGGEPLIHPNVTNFIEEGKKYFDDVGLTTNGVFLPEKIESLFNAGIDRIHISLQIESMISKKSKDWKIPDFIEPVLDYLLNKEVSLRLNMPVPMDSLFQAEKFTQLISKYECDLNLFSILPENIFKQEKYDISKLEDLITRENARRERNGKKGRLMMRGYRKPTGIRCKTCKDFDFCKESSHSLRLGADYKLRPCLASREWDSELDFNKDVKQQILNSATLAVDY